MAELGVHISLQKTHESKDTYEFAKRWVHRGVEISGATLNGFVDDTKYYLVIEHIRRLWTR